MRRSWDTYAKCPIFTFEQVELNTPVRTARIPMSLAFSLMLGFVIRQKAPPYWNVAVPSRALAPARGKREPKIRELFQPVAVKESAF